MRDYPNVPREAVEETRFGIKIADPYRYLEDRDAERTRTIVAEENAYTARYFEENGQGEALRACEAALRRKPQPLQLSMIGEADGVLCATRKLDGGRMEVVSLDSELNVTGTLISDDTVGGRMHVYSAVPCPKHPGIYGVMGVKHGAPRCCVLVYEKKSGKILAELDNTFGFGFSEDGTKIYYCEAELDPQNTSSTLKAQQVEWASGAVKTLYSYTGTAVTIDMEPAHNGCVYMSLMINYTDVLPLWCDAEGTVTQLGEGKGSLSYIGEHDGTCYLMTDRGAPYRKLIALPTEKMGWAMCLTQAETVLADAGCLLTGAGIMPDGILAAYQRDAVSELKLYGFDGTKIADIELPDRYCRLTASGRLMPTDSGRLFMGYESFTTPPAVLAYDTAAHSLRFVCGSHENADDLAVEQVFLPARDGQRILVYLVRPADLVRGGETPVLMYGYGGYASSMPPWSENMVTAQNIAEWVRMGRIYAHCIIRGGLEYGTAWHEDAMKNRKKNAFTDFIDIARYLVKDGWTKPEKIIATGMSNGGLLMTAIATIAPEDFGIVIASVPHTDMIRFRYDDRGMMYVTEYGDPLESEEMLRYMLSYSPYHNIRPGTVYPAMYVQTGEMDNNVPPYHGKKFAVRMQAEASQERPVLLQVLAHGSHNRGVGDEYYRNVAQMQTFIEMQLKALG